MGIIKDIINAKVVGSEVRKGIKEVKSKEKEILTCDNCGKKLTEEQVVARCSIENCGEISEWSGKLVKPTLLCKDCVKKCNNCEKFVCLEHYRKGLCKKCYKKENGFFSW